ncbi:MAG: hypothetical protein V1701_05155 [Planctomycetota bacterium]
MNDIRQWAGKMARIGDYKRKENARCLNKISIRQRIKMIEELVLMADMPVNVLPASRLFCSLAKSLEKRYASKA